MEVTNCEKIFDPVNMVYIFTPRDVFYCSFNYDHSTKIISNFKTLNNQTLTKFLYEFECNLKLEKLFNLYPSSHIITETYKYKEVLNSIDIVEIHNYGITFKDSSNENIIKIHNRDDIVNDFCNNIIKVYKEFLEFVNRPRNVKSARS